MASVLHSFLQTISAVIVLGFILQMSLISQSTLSLNIIGFLHSSTPVAMILLLNKLFALISLFILMILFLIKHFLIKPSYIRNINTIVYFALGFALLGFAKLTLGEMNAFTFGFINKSKSLVGKTIAVEHNVIRIRDYSTMYSSPNGYFFFFVLLVNLIGVRSFSSVKKSGDPIDTKLPSRDEKRKSSMFENKRRKSIDENDLSEIKSMDISIKDNSNIEALSDVRSHRHNTLESTRKFELFEKEFSMQSPDNLSQADSYTSDVKSSSSVMFLEKFENIKKPSSILSLLLTLRAKDISLEKTEPKQVLFWMMTYSNFKRLSSILVVYLALTLYTSGNGFITDLMFGFLLSKVFSRFFFRVLDR